MREADLLSMIRQVLRQELCPILIGLVTDSESVNRLTVTRFPSDNAQSNLRNIQPYGFASRPPDQMPSLVIPLAQDPSNQQVVGQFDQNRPSLEKGEVAIYGPAGQSLVFKADGKIYTGADGTPVDETEPVVLGNTLKEFLSLVLDALLNATQIGFDSLGGPVQLDPGIRALLVQYKATYLDNPDTNILSSKSFVERG